MINKLMKNSIKHWHHIIPKHMGGSDNPENLIELTVAEHAEAHRKLYEQYGKTEDYVAWQGLAKLIGKEAVLHESYRLGGLNKIEKHGSPFKGRRTSGNWANNPKLQARCQKLASSEESRKKAKQKLSEIKHQQGEKNSMFGTMWIHNSSLRISKRIMKTEDIPEGWEKGRKIY